MKRREFIAILGGTAAWPLAAHAQQQAPMPVVGFLGSASTPNGWLTAFQQGLQETGYTDGRHVTIEYSWADGQYSRLPTLAADLVRRLVAVIVAAGANVSALAAKEATSTIPIVFIMGDDPVRLGLVASLGRPGGSITGATLFAGGLIEKRIEFLRELVPTARAFGILVNPDNPGAERFVKRVSDALGTTGEAIRVLKADGNTALEGAFATLAQEPADALSIMPDSVFGAQPDQLVALAKRHSVPVIYTSRAFADAGGLISYGSVSTDTYRQAGIYVGRILKGEKPADLPVQQPTKFELIINLKTAKALGLTVPQSMLLRADEVIE